MSTGGPSVRPASVGEGVLQFLSSLGKRSEAELYLRLFRELPVRRFAALIPTEEVLRSSSGTLADQLRFLLDLGLSPTVILGGLGTLPEDLTAHFLAALDEARVNYVLGDMDSGKSESDDGAPAVLVLSAESRGIPDLLGLVSALRPRRTLFLRRGGGLGPHRDRVLEISPGHVLGNDRSGIGVINLRSDAAELRDLELFSAEDRGYLDLASSILEGPLSEDARATVSVASPLSIVRELFTVSGEGTLIKLGSRIQTFDGLSGLDQARVYALIEESFGRPLYASFRERAPLKIYLEADYRGVAFLETGKDAAFLSKFAVLPEARGEGLGQDLWWSITRDFPSLYFRARPDNPINAWYSSVCHGVHRSREWNVYWRSALPERLPALISDALSRPVDLAPPQDKSEAK